MNATEVMLARAQVEEKRLKHQVAELEQLSMNAERNLQRVLGLLREEQEETKSLNRQIIEYCDRLSSIVKRERLANEEIDRANRKIDATQDKVVAERTRRIGAENELLKVKAAAYDSMVQERDA